MDKKNYVITLPNGEKANLSVMEGWEFFFKDVLNSFSDEKKETIKQNIIAAIKYTK